MTTWYILTCVSLSLFLIANYHYRRGTSSRGLQRLWKGIVLLAWHFRGVRKEGRGKEDYNTSCVLLVYRYHMLVTCWSHAGHQLCITSCWGLCAVLMSIRCDIITCHFNVFLNLLRTLTWKNGEGRPSAGQRHSMLPRKILSCVPCCVAYPWALHHWSIISRWYSTLSPSCVDWGELVSTPVLRWIVCHVVLPTPGHCITGL